MVAANERVSLSTKKRATAEESTPPDMATAMVSAVRCVDMAADLT